LIEHDGLRQDGQPDKRVGTGVFNGGDPKELGAKGGKASGGSGESDDSSNSTGGDYKPTENNGLKKDGTPDGRVNNSGSPTTGDSGAALSSNSSDDDPSSGDSGAATSGGDYKPTEHDGLKQDGTPDRRVKGNN